MQGKVHVDAMAAVYVGIDVCKERLDVYLHPTGERFAVANDAGGWRSVRRRLAALPVAMAVLEATSKYHRAVHRRLAAARVPVAVVQPLRARLFAQACGMLAKNDAIDARMLALMGARLELAAAPPPPAEVEVLAELARARTAAVADRTATANRLATSVHPAVRRELASELRCDDRRIARYERIIAAHIAAHPGLAARCAILRSIPGIGTVTAARFNPDLKRFHQRLRDAGKPPKVAITAVMRKLIVLANHLIAQQRHWTPNPA